MRFGNLLPTRLCRAATTKPRQIERSGFFLLDHNGKTRIYRLVSGSYDVPLWRKRDSPIVYDDYAPPPKQRLQMYCASLPFFKSEECLIQYFLILTGGKILDGLHKCFDLYYKQELQITSNPASVARLESTFCVLLSLLCNIN